jgi:hypothetical protein
VNGKRTGLAGGQLGFQDAAEVHREGVCLLEHAADRLDQWGSLLLRRQRPHAAHHQPVRPRQQLPMPRHTVQSASDRMELWGAAPSPPQRTSTTSLYTFSSVMGLPDGAAAAAAVASVGEARLLVLSKAPAVCGIVGMPVPFASRSPRRASTSCCDCCTDDANSSHSAMPECGTHMRSEEMHVVVCDLRCMCMCGRPPPSTSAHIFLSVLMPAPPPVHMCVCVCACVCDGVPRAKMPRSRLRYCSWWAALSVAFTSCMCANLVCASTAT